MPTILMPCAANVFRNPCSALQVGHQVAHTFTSSGSAGRARVSSPDSTVFRINCGNGLPTSGDGSEALSSTPRPIQTGTPSATKIPSGTNDKVRFRRQPPPAGDGPAGSVYPESPAGNPPT